MRKDNKKKTHSTRAQGGTGKVSQDWQKFEPVFVKIYFLKWKKSVLAL